MKIVYVISQLGYSGGIERVLSTKANYLADIFGYEVHIVVGRKQPDSLFYHFSGNIYFHYLNVEFSKRSILQYFFEIKQDKIYHQRLEKKLNEIRPDITISAFGDDATFLYKIKDGSKKILEFHYTKNYLKHLGNAISNDKYRFIRKYWLKFLQIRETYLASKYEHIVLLTEKDKQLWKGDSKFTVIPNPLSLVTAEKALLENKWILAMGRFVAPKGFDLLIRAFALLKEKFPDWSLFIYGEGYERESLTQMIKELSLQNNVFLKSPVEDVEKIMLDSSLFVSTSLYEGFGLALVEAMTCGLPCVAFDCECGPSEIMKDNEDGFLVETGNIQMLATKMKLLMENQQLRKQMGINAKNNIQRFSIQFVMKQWEEFFQLIKYL